MLNQKDTVTKINKVSIVIKFYKVERELWINNYKFFSKIIWRLIYILFSCHIPPTCELEDGVNIAHGVGIVIHQNARIGKGTIIYQNVTIGSGNGPIIGKNCILGAGSCILGDIKIGNNVRIGANAVVLKDIPDDSTVVGIPGRIIKRKDCVF